MLTAIKFKVENSLQVKRASQSRSENKSLETIVPMIQGSIEEVRRIQMDLRPSILDDLGILATIGWLCREFEKVYSTIRIEKEIGLQETDISVALKTVIYRIMQEALNNVAKHSRADHVRISLRKIDGRLELRVKDNGVGFDLKEAFSVKNDRRGFGLSGMRERTELSGGAFLITSAKGSGTTVQVSWPAA